MVRSPSLANWSHCGRSVARSRGCSVRAWTSARWACVPGSPTEFKGAEADREAGELTAPVARALAFGNQPGWFLGLTTSIAKLVAIETACGISHPQPPRHPFMDQLELRASLLRLMSDDANPGSRPSYTGEFAVKVSDASAAGPGEGAGRKHQRLIGPAW